MITYTFWEVRTKGGLKVATYDGWFLLWFIPLYVRKLSERRG
jgi:hypothetical protein